MELTDAAAHSAHSPPNALTDVGVSTVGTASRLWVGSNLISTHRNATRRNAPQLRYWVTEHVIGHGADKQFLFFSVDSKIQHNGATQHWRKKPARAQAIKGSGTCT